MFNYEVYFNRFIELFRLKYVNVLNYINRYKIMQDRKLNCKINRSNDAFLNITFESVTIKFLCLLTL